MTQQELDAIRAALKAAIDYSTHLTQGVANTQLLVVDALLKSGAMNRDILTKDVKAALEALTDEAKATAFPHALLQLAKLLGLETAAPTDASTAAWAQMQDLIDRLKRP